MALNSALLGGKSGVFSFIKMEKLYRVAVSRTKIPITKRDLERAIAALLVCDDIWEIIDLSDVPFIALCVILDVFKEEGLLEVDGSKLILTDEGKKLASSMRIEPALAFKCQRCNGRGIEIETMGDIARFKEIAFNRPQPLQKYDQGYVTVETTLARVALMWERGDLAGKEIIVLGDDDLVSIAAGLTGKPARVIAIDIDKRLVELINEVAKEHDLKIKAYLHDLSKPLPRGWLESFDTFVTDPPESLQALKAFLERGLVCLKGIGSAGYFGLTRRESSLAKWHKLQLQLLRWGVCITDLIDDFNEYLNWGYIEDMGGWKRLPTFISVSKPKGIWYRSSFYRVEVIRKAKYTNDPLLIDFEDVEAATT